MEELKIMYEIITAIWKLCKKYGSRRLTCEQWAIFTEEGKALRERFRQNGDEFDLLYRGLFMALQDYYIRKGMEHT